MWYKLIVILLVIILGTFCKVNAMTIKIDEEQKTCTIISYDHDKDRNSNPIFSGNRFVNVNPFHYPEELHVSNISITTTNVWAGSTTVRCNSLKVGKNSSDIDVSFTYKNYRYSCKTNNKKSDLTSNNISRQNDGSNDGISEIPPYSKSTTLTSINNNVLQSDISRNNFTMIMLEGTPVNWNIQQFGVNFPFDKIKCNAMGDPDKIYLDKKIIRFSFMILPITEDMSGIWNCTLLSKYSKLPLYIKVNFRPMESPLTIVINNMVLKVLFAPPNILDFDYIVSYKYKKNDELDIICLHKTETDNCVLEFEYENEKNVKNVTISPISSYLKLNTENDLKYVDCVSKCQGYNRRLRINFILMNESYGLNLHINNRPIRLNKNRGGIQVLNFVFLKNEPINFICNTSSDITSDTICDNTCGVEDSCNIEIFTSKMPCVFYCRDSVDDLMVNITYKNFESNGDKTPITVALTLLLVVSLVAIISFLVYRKRKSKAVENTYEYPVFPREPMPIPTSSPTVNSLEIDDSSNNIYCYAVPH